MELTPGTKLFSMSSTAQVVVVKAPAGDVDLRCGGEPMAMAAPPDASGAGSDAGDALLLGKRYSDEAGQLELLCTRSGAGPLTVGGVVLPLKAAKPLPASD